MIPVRMFLYGMEMLVKNMRGVQTVTDRSFGVIADGDSANGERGGSTTVGSSNTTQSAVPGDASVGKEPANTQTVRDHATISKESAKMPDTNLNDDMLKLVRYKILFIKRDYEYAFPEKEELVHDNMSDSAFTAWKVAEFIQSLDRIEVPEAWHDMKPPYPTKQESRKLPDGRTVWVIHAFDETDKKFLRVYFEVLQRYAREKLLYEEDQLTALRGIQGAIESIQRHGVPHLSAPVGGSADAGGKRKE